MTECTSCNSGNTAPIASMPIDCDPVIFHKVVIPASMGDESQVPPTAGKYKNVLLQYEYNEHIYIYSSDGIPTYIRNNGSFNDLANRPRYNNQMMTGNTNIPAVNDGTITITKNGSAVGDFTTNQSTNETINIVVPTKTSDLTNDSNFVSDAAYVHTDNNYTTADKTKLTSSVEIDTIGANLTYNSTTKTLSADAQPAILYGSTGNNTDGAMTQKATTEELSTKATTAQLSAVQQQIPTTTSQLTNNSNFVSDASYVHTDNNYTNSDANAVDNLDQNVGYDLTISSDQSTATITENKTNLYTGVETTELLPLPVASASNAGVMNALTFQAIQSNSDNISAILDGAVALSGLPASPTQAELTTAWQAATGRTTVINRSQINDQTNNKIWTYYTNVSQWTAAANTPTVVVNDATNSSKGIIKGSASGDGTVFVESDATMSVNGWDTLSAAVTANTANIANKANTADLSSVAFTGLYSDLLSTPSIPTKTSDLTNDSSFVSDTYYVHTDNNYSNADKNKLTGIEAGAEVNDIDTIKVNGTTQTIVSKAVDIATITATPVLDTSTVTPIVTTGLIADEAVTAPKIIDNAVTAAKIANGAVTSSKIDFTTFSMIDVSGSYGDSDCSINSIIVLDVEKGKIGSKLSLSNNKIVVGAGVSKVLLSASVFYRKASSGQNYGWFTVKKNNSDIGISAITNVLYADYGSATTGLRLVSVQEGDELCLWNNEYNQVRGTNTSLTVIALA